jgi:TPR repeat protein
MNPATQRPLATVVGHALRGTVLAMSLALVHPLVAADPYADGFNAALDGDYRTAAIKWTELATGNDGRAQFQLALLYHAGLHVEQDERMAVKLYQSAAENGVPEAQEYLAVGYHYGWFGLPKDDKRAAHWLSRLEQEPLNQIAHR